MLAGDNPLPPLGRDLMMDALSVTPVGSSWSISYTVFNNGRLSAPASTVRFSGNGISTTGRSVAPIAAGGRQSGTLQLPRSADCYLQLVATADSGSVVSESNEFNNTRQALGVVTTCQARYRVSAVSFKAVDESGIDWTGSDEPYWIFNTVSNGAASTKSSPVFGDVDTGEVRYFNSTDGCLWGCSGSIGAPADFGLGLSIQLWEKDLGHVSQTLYDTAKAFKTAGPILTAAGAPAWVGVASSTMGAAMNFILGWADDDLLGSNTYAYSAANLAANLPSPGTSFDDVRTYTGGDATYTLTMRVSRII